MITEKEIKTNDYNSSNGIQDIIDLNKIYADFVFCVDLTYSTTQIIDEIKKIIFSLYDDLTNFYFTPPKQLRIKVLGYSNCCDENKSKIEMSKFFCIPNEMQQLQLFVNDLKVKGIKNGINNSLEALSMAIQSDWCKPKVDDTIIRKRHCIILFTGAAACPLSSYGGSNAFGTLPKSYIELVDMWSGQDELVSGGTSVEMDQRAKRLMLMAPKGSEPWTDIADDFDWSWSLLIDIKDDIKTKISYLYGDIFKFIDENF